MRLWDLRKPGSTLGMLQSCMAAVRSIRFSPDGRLCVAAEAADFVHILDVHSGFTRHALLWQAHTAVCYWTLLLMVRWQATKYGLQELQLQRLWCW